MWKVMEEANLVNFSIICCITNWSWNDFLSPLFWMYGLTSSYFSFILKTVFSVLFAIIENCDSFVDNTSFGLELQPLDDFIININYFWCTFVAFPEFPLMKYEWRVKKGQISLVQSSRFNVFALTYIACTCKWKLANSIKDFSRVKIQHRPICPFILFP